MFNCSGCWDNPCTCGKNYGNMSAQQKLSLISSLSTQLFEGDTGPFHVDQRLRPQTMMAMAVLIDRGFILAPESKDCYRAPSSIVVCHQSYFSGVVVHLASPKAICTATDSSVMSAEKWLEIHPLVKDAVALISESQQCGPHLSYAGAQVLLLNAVYKAMKE